MILHFLEYFFQIDDFEGCESKGGGWEEEEEEVERRGVMAQRSVITCDEEIHSQNVSMRSRYKEKEEEKKVYQNRQEYKSHIGGT